jgi:hypothetical protein
MWRLLRKTNPSCRRRTHFQTHKRIASGSETKNDCVGEGQQQFTGLDMQSSTNEINSALQLSYSCTKQEYWSSKRLEKAVVDGSELAKAWTQRIFAEWGSGAKSLCSTKRETTMLSSIPTKGSRLTINQSISSFYSILEHRAFLTDSVSSQALDLPPKFPVLGPLLQQFSARLILVCLSFAAPGDSSPGLASLLHSDLYVECVLPISISFLLK